MWLDLLFAQVSRSVEQNVHTTFSSQIHFQNPKNYSFGDVQRFCNHSWCDSTVIFDQISNSSHVYLSSSRFGRPPLSSFSASSLPFRNREYHLKLLTCSEPHSHKPSAPILVFLSQIDRLSNKILWQLTVHFRRPWRIQKTDFSRQVITRTLSKINKRNSLCERMLIDSTMLVVWPIDRSSSVI